jgi:hypothetical protein
MVPFHLPAAPLSAAVLVSRTPEARDCPDVERLSTRVEHIIGRAFAPRSGAAPAILVRADFTRAVGAYEARVELSGAREGERLLRDEGATCDALADAVSVTVALMLDPSQPPPPRPPPARSWFELWLMPRFGIVAGLVGAPTWIGGGAVEGSIGPLASVSAGGSFTGSHANRLDPGSVRVGSWYAELAGFRSLTGDDLRFGPCVSLMGGALRGTGEGYPATSSASLTWFAVGAGLRTDLRVGPSIRLALRAIAVAPTRRESFFIAYVGTVQPSSTFAGMADITLALRSF